MRMAPPITAWTRVHSSIALTVILAVGGAAIGAAEGIGQPRLAIALGVALGATVILSLATNPWAGILAGLASAVGLTVYRQATGTWVPTQLMPAALETAVLVLSGWAAGMTARALVRNRAQSRSGEHQSEGVFGSIGLLRFDLAMVSLEDEVARAKRFERPLTLALIETRVSVEQSQQQREAIQRTVARLTESLLRTSDVPFALAGGEIGAILPETDATAAWVAMGRITEAISAATFTDRTTNERHALAGAADVHLSLAVLGTDGDTGSDLLMAALEAVSNPSDDPG